MKMNNQVDISNINYLRYMQEKDNNGNGDTKHTSRKSSPPTPDNKK